MQDAVVDRIKEEMQRLGLTRRELARRLNSVTDKPITEQALGLWFARGRVPSSRMADLERVLQTPVTLDENEKMFQVAFQRTIAKVPQPRQAAPISAQAQMLADWLDKIQDPMVKLECFHGCTALLMQALRQPTPTALPAAPHQP